MQLSRRDFLKTSGSYITGATGIAAIAGLSGATTSAFAVQTSKDEAADASSKTEASRASDAAIDKSATSDIEVSDELLQAGGIGAQTWLGAEPVINESDISSTLNCEVLVIGAGSAGMIGAATAVDEGADVIIIESQTAVCQARHWIGAVNTKWQAEAGITVDIDQVKKALLVAASGRMKLPLADVWISESGEMLEFIQNTIGDNYNEHIVLQDDVPDDASYFIPPIQHNIQPVTMSDDDFLFTMEDQNQLFEKWLSEKGVDVKFETSLVKLEKNSDNRVTGCIAQDADGNYLRINASKGVLLATGGYINDPQMMLARQPEAIAASNGAFISYGSLGTGLRAGIWAGGIIRDDPTCMIQNRSLVAPGTTGGYIEGQPGKFPSVGQWTFGTQPFMAVNQYGKRFTNEDAPNDFIVHAAGKYPNGTWCQIFDSSWREDTKRFHTTGCSRMWPSSSETKLYVISESMVESDLEKYTADGTIIKADTIEELAEGLGLPVDTFVDEVEKYNGYADAGHDDDFGKSAVCLSRIDEPPYYGVTLGGLLNTTLDGLDIDTDMRVLDTNGDPIAGLWAAGDVAGGFFNSCYPWHIVGVACGKTMTFGRHAAKNILGLN